MNFKKIAIVVTAATAATATYVGVNDFVLNPTATAAQAQVVNLKATNGSFNLSVNKTDITTDDKGYAHISGVTAPDVQVTAGLLHSDVSDEKGEFTIVFPLKAAKTMDVSLNATSTDGKSNDVTVTLHPSQAYLKIADKYPAGADKPVQ